MQNTHLLIGCIDKLGDTISTRFFYVSKEKAHAKDVTLELCEAIDAYNYEAQQIRNTGTYAMMIPYDYKYGLANYSFGCGLSHYLQDKEFEKIQEASKKVGMNLSFPLADCTMFMFTPHDVKKILSCNHVFDRNIQKALVHHYGLDKTA